jgi:hypothetical protein
MTPKEFRAERNKLERAVKAQLAPYLYPSGYRLGPIGQSRPLLLWVPRDKKGELLRKKFKLQGALLLHEGFEGFTEEGVIDDSYGHGLSTVFWKGIPIEDLFRLNNWLTRMLPKLTVNDRPKASKAPCKSATAQAAMHP